MEVLLKTELGISRRVAPLLRLCMIIYSKKTEAMYYGKLSKCLTFICQNAEIITRAVMQVIGIYFDERLSWTHQIKSRINKISRLTSRLKLLRKKLSKRFF